MTIEYAIVTSLKTQRLWPEAVKALQSKYEDKWPGKVRLVRYDAGSGVRSCLPMLRECVPSYTCFLEHHSLCSAEFVRHVNQLTRELDPSTPYGDTVWGILTGYVEEDVLFAVRQPPLTLRRATGNCPMWEKAFQSGLWFSEWQKGVASRKLPTEAGPQRESCPDDATLAFVRELSAWRDIEKDQGVDFIHTSGHATEAGLEMGYNFQSGSLRSCKGQLCAHPLSGSQPVAVRRNDSPKVLSAAGNCLMGHIADENSMALGWMHSACVVQMTGYIVPTWFGYGGWGVNNYLCEEPGGMSFSEAFFANQQALLHKLHSKYGGMGAEVSQDTREWKGLLYDRDNVAFYGDPAWAAALDSDSPHARHSHIVIQRSSEPDKNGWIEWEYHLVTHQSAKWDRPPVYVFPSRVQGVELVSGDAILTCRFLLIPLTGKYGPGKQHVVMYKTLSV